MEHFWWWIRFYALRLGILAAVIGLSWFAVKSAIKPVGLVDNSQNPESSKILIDPYSSAYKTLSPEQKSFMQSAGVGKSAVTYEVYTPMTNIQRQLNRLQQSLSWPISKINLFLAYLYSKRDTAAGALKLFITFSFLTLAGLRIFKRWHQMRIVSSLLIELSKAMIVPLSIAALIAAFGFRVNIWQTADFAFFWVPVGMLLIGSLGLWSVDDNYPIWKAMYAELMFPIASGVGILVKNMFF